MGIFQCIRSNALSVLVTFLLEWDRETKKSLQQSNNSPQDTMIEKRPTPQHRKNECLPQLGIDIITMLHQEVFAYDITVFYV